MIALVLLIINLALCVKTEVCSSIMDDGGTGSPPDPLLVYRYLTPSGYAQCIKECERYAECGSVSYDRGSLTCTLLRSTAAGTQILLGNTATLDACSGVFCNTDEVCVAISYGTSYCAPVEPWCPNYIGGRCYTISEKAINWDLAKAACESNGYSLATVDSAELLTSLGNGLPTGTTAYVGGSDALTEGQWLWIDNNNTVNFSGVPNDLGYREEQDCLAIDVDPDPQLTDIHCHTDRLFICQSQPIN